MTPLIKQILEAALEGEMDAHISECKDDGQPNRRNGKMKKTVKTGTGSFELETPRDREGTKVLSTSSNATLSLPIPL